MYDRSGFFAAPLPLKMNGDKTVTLAVRGGTRVAPELAILRRSASIGGKHGGSWRRSASIEHEAEEGDHELELQLKWQDA